MASTASHSGSGALTNEPTTNVASGARLRASAINAADWSIPTTPWPASSSRRAVTPGPQPSSTTVERGRSRPSTKAAASSATPE
jgi:hypothetical protein